MAYSCPVRYCLLKVQLKKIHRRERMPITWMRQSGKILPLQIREIIEFQNKWRDRNEGTCSGLYCLVSTRCNGDFRQGREHASCIGSTVFSLHHENVSAPDVWSLSRCQIFLKIFRQSFGMMLSVGPGRAWTFLVEPENFSGDPSKARRHKQRN